MQSSFTKKHSILSRKNYGADNVISAVMHADEINVAATEELGKEVYHYHLHAMVLPVVEKEILWSKRCKDEKLRGTVKEVVHQISHSKKWKSDIPLTDEKGNPLLRKNGKPMFRASYSILQDELFNHMTEQGFKGFQRGEYGSTAEHLTSLQYQIKQDKERLEKLQKSARLAELNALLNIDRDRSSSQDAPEETEETETPTTRPSVLAALGEKTNQPEPVKPFRSYYDKDGDAR